jgi:hypothetical protein
VDQIEGMKLGTSSNVYYLYNQCMYYTGEMLLSECKPTNVHNSNSAFLLGAICSFDFLCRDGCSVLVHS